MFRYRLAQLNIARLLAPMDSPVLADFVSNLDRINALADTSPGFVWRLQSEEGDATSIRPFGEEYIVNVSIWEDLESLHDFVYRSAHVDILRRRKDWFEKMPEAYSVLWWVPRNHLPTTAEAKERLLLLQLKGPAAEAFTFKTPYPSPDAEPGEAVG